MELSNTLTLAGIIFACIAGPGLFVIGLWLAYRDRLIQKLFRAVMSAQIKAKRGCAEPQQDKKTNRKQHRR